MTDDTRSRISIEAGSVSVFFPNCESATWLTPDQARHWAKGLTLAADYAAGLDAWAPIGPDKAQMPDA